MKAKYWFNGDFVEIEDIKIDKFVRDIIREKNLWEEIANTYKKAIELIYGKAEQTE